MLKYTRDPPRFSHATASVVPALGQLVRCPQHRDPVLLLHPVDAGIDPLAQVFRGEGVIGLGVQYGSDRPLDRPGPLLISVSLPMRVIG